MDADSAGNSKGNLGFAATSDLCTENTALFGVAKFAPANKEVPEAVEELAEGVVNAAVVEVADAQKPGADASETADEKESVGNRKVLIAVAIIVALAIPAGMYFIVSQSQKNETKASNTSTLKSEKNIRRTRRARTQSPNNFKNRNHRPKTKSKGKRKSKKR